jgi:elongation factor Ts
LEISADLVKTLREKTGCGFMDCKKALRETAGNLEQAVAYLRQKGVAVATKRGERATSEGAVFAQVMPDGQGGVLLEVNCETDFVAKTSAFQEFGARLAAQIAATAPANLEELLAQPWQGQPGRTVKDHLNDLIGQVGENLRVQRFCCFPDGGLAAAYIHHGSRIGVLLQMEAGPASPEVAAAAKDLAMQVAATNPLAVRREELDSEVVAKERAIFTAQARESGKPENIQEKMVAGRLEKFYKEACLREQPFVKNPEIAVAQYLKDISQQSGQPLEVKRFCRFQVGVA